MTNTVPLEPPGVGFRYASVSISRKESVSTAHFGCSSRTGVRESGSFDVGSTPLSSTLPVYTLSRAELKMTAAASMYSQGDWSCCLEFGGGECVARTVSRYLRSETQS